MRIGLTSRFTVSSLARVLVPGAVLTVTALLARQYASLNLLVALLVLSGGAVLVQNLTLGLPALVATALIVPVSLRTGTEVALNPASVLVPVLLALWMLDSFRRRDLRLARSRTNRPLLLFLVAGLFSLLIGLVLWDPAVPRSASFTVVQLAQWAIFAFSAGAFWLTGNLVHDEVWLRRLTFLFLVLASGLAILLVTVGSVKLVDTYRVATNAVIRPPFLMLLTALAGGQLLFDPKLSSGWQLFLSAVLVAVLIYAFGPAREVVSIWLGVVVVIGMLVWLRWPHLRKAFVVLGILGLVVLFPKIYEFAGGQAEWEVSGGSRLALINRVVEVTMRNPITGLGPAAYRAYAGMKPLLYERAYWLEPQVNSHNNYVDLFSHVGVLGLSLFFWFAIEVMALGFQLRNRFTVGFAAGYVNAMLAVWIGSLVVMALADWILPFVYNIGFSGFQASVLVWMFLGGLISLEQVARGIPARVTDDKR